MSQATELPLVQRPPARAWSNVLSTKKVRAQSTANFWGPVFAVLVGLIWLGALAYGFKTAIMLIAILGFGGAVAGFRWPVLGLFSVGLLAEHDNLIRVCLADGSSTIFRENTFNYVLLLMVLMYGHRLLLRRDPHTWFLLALIGLLTVELYLSPGMDRGFAHVLNAVAGCGFLLYFMRGVKDDNVWYWLAMVNGIGAALGGAMYYLQKSSLEEFHIDRNGLAYFFLTGIFTICLGFRFASLRLSGTVILGGLAVLCGCWVFLTASRGGSLIGLTAFACLFAQVRGAAARTTIITLGCLVAMGVLAKFANEQLHSTARWNKLFDEDRSLASRTSGRSDLMYGAWKIFSANPLGVGTGGYALAYKEISRNEGEFSFGKGHDASAHSAWMKLLAENGIPGVLLLAGYVFSFAHVGWKKKREGLFLIGLLATVALGVSFISSEFQGKGLWYLAAGVTVLLHRPASTSNANLQQNGKQR